METITKKVIITTFVAMLFRVEDCTCFEHELASCITTIIQSHFKPDESIAVSLPNTEEFEKQNNSLKLPLHADDIDIASKILQDINENTQSKIQIFGQMETDLTILDVNIVKPRSYINFVQTKEEEEIIESLEDQLNVFQDNENWNSRAKFLIVIMKLDIEIREKLALDVAILLQESFSIYNAVILIPRGEMKQNEYSEKKVHIIIEIYSWFPFESKNCGHVKEIILIDTCDRNTNANRSKTNLYPNKIPKDFNKCPIKLSFFGFPPFLVTTNNYKHTKNGNTYNVSGSTVDCVLIAIEKLNLKSEISQIVTNFDYNESIKFGTNVISGVYDIVIGFMPLSLHALSLGEYTIPLVFETFMIIVPCPAPISRVTRCLSIYTISLWFVLLLVLVLTVLLFSYAANIHNVSVKESHIFKTLTSSFVNAWAVFIGVSVPQMPRTTILRAYFFLFVCYSFAICTVFQAFFVTYLVEPGYGKPISSFDELLLKGIIFERVEVLDFGTSLVNVELEFNSKSQSYCTEYEKCVSNVIKYKNNSLKAVLGHADYVAKKLGITERSNAVCWLEDVQVDFYMTSYVTKGSYFVERMNSIIRLCMEAGLNKKLFSESMNSVLVKNGGRNVFENEDVFVFSISHLAPAFGALIIGCLISCVVFLFEIMWSFSNKKK